MKTSSLLLLLVAALAPLSGAANSAFLEWVSLSGLEPASAKVGYANFERGALTSEGRQVEVKGVKVRDGLFAHAPSKLVYSLAGGKFLKLRGKVGLEDNFFGEVRFKILGDGRPLWQSGPIKKEKQQRPAKVEDFEVDLNGITTLELVVDPISSMNDDHSVWIKPELARERSR